jgi:hypothetical protein
MMSDDAVSSYLWLSCTVSRLELSQKLVPNEPAPETLVVPKYLNTARKSKQFQS